MSASRPRRRVASILRASDRRPVVTYTLIGINVVVFLLQLVTGGQGGQLTNALTFVSVTEVFTQPWRLVTSLFAHANFFHILFNMYSLYLFGAGLENLLGRWRYLALYLISGIGGLAGVMLLAPGTAVLGASGAIFGLFAAFFIIQRHLGGNAAQVLILIVLNLALGFFVSGIAWQAHLGGAIAGALIAMIYVATRARRRLPLQIAGVTGVALLVALGLAVPALA